MHGVWLVLPVLLYAVSFAGPAIKLKTRQIEAAASPAGEGRGGIPAGGRREAMHVLVQFAAPPGAAEVRALEDRGIRVLQYVPDNAFLVLLDRDASLDGLGLAWAGPLAYSDKISPDWNTAADSTAVVEFHPDIGGIEQRWIFLRNGIEAVENPDLAPNHLLARVRPGDLERLSNEDGVAYIFPASSDLSGGRPVRPCLSALTGVGRAAQFIPVIGEGWDGPGLGEASLKYVFSSVTNRLPADSAKTEILRAYTIWSKYVKVDFQPGTDPNGTHTLNILFASRAHGDGYPFDGPGGILAHTFYPSPPNPEPIAGDMHFDADERWHIGVDVDLFSVALHETGHALGLGHSDRPGDVMYPYYSITSDLTAHDVAAVRRLYAARDADTSAPPPTNPGTPTPPPASPPIAISITIPVAPVAQQRYTFFGTTSGGTGSVQVTWTANGASGTATGSSQWTATVPLVAGLNQIAFQATDGNKKTAAKTVTVMRSQLQPNPPSPDTTAPSLTITSPSSAVVATSEKSIVLSGTASDSVGVAAVTWTTAFGDYGTATGTDKWQTGPVALFTGVNTILVQAADAAGNKAWRTVMVTRR